MRKVVGHGAGLADDEQRLVLPVSLEPILDLREQAPAPLADLVAQKAGGIRYQSAGGVPQGDVVAPPAMELDIVADEDGGE